jgi:nucleotide-binding universal stress UspA family protein
VWVTLAFTKVHALIFVVTVMAVGLTLRQLTRYAAARRPKPSLLRRAIMEQLTPEALLKPRFLLATAGSSAMAVPALSEAQKFNAALVVCFVREVALSYKVEAENVLSLDTDPAAQALFTDFLARGHEVGVPIIPVYDTGPNPAELIAENAAIHAVQRVFMGSSRRGTLHRLIKGSFLRKLETLLPPDTAVDVLEPSSAP